jgi:hypothetical protein
MLNFQLAMDSLERLMFKIMDKIEAHEAKLRHIRKDVDAYFDDM